MRLLSGSRLGFAVKAENEDKSGVVGDESENEARGLSTMPERFRYLNQEAPDPPVRWPYFVGIYLSCLRLLCRVLLPVFFYYCYCNVGVYGKFFVWGMGMFGLVLFSVKIGVIGCCLLGKLLNTRDIMYVFRLLG